MRRVRDRERRRREVLQRVAGRSCDRDAFDVPVFARVYRAGGLPRVRAGVAPGAVPDARSEADVGHPAARERSAGPVDLGPGDSRRAFQQHRQPTGRAPRRAEGAQSEDRRGGARAVRQGDARRIGQSGCRCGRRASRVPGVSRAGAGGIRLLLVATDKSKGATKTPTAPGSTGDRRPGRDRRQLPHRDRTRRRGALDLLPARHRQHRELAGEHAVALRVRHAGRWHSLRASRRLVAACQPERHAGAGAGIVSAGQHTRPGVLRAAGRQCLAGRDAAIPRRVRACGGHPQARGGHEGVVAADRRPAGPDRAGRHLHRGIRTGRRGGPADRPVALESAAPQLDATQ